MVLDYLNRVNCIYMHVGDTLTLRQKTQNLQFNNYQTQEVY